MRRIKCSVLIDASPEAVWEIINDAGRWPEWVAFTDRVIYVSDWPYGEGTVYREQGGPLEDSSQAASIETETGTEKTGRISMRNPTTEVGSKT